MRIFVITLLLLTTTFSFSQSKGLDTWTIGAGANNFLMHGDLTSVNSKSSKFLNTGFYVYLNKMISPTFGFEVKGQVLKMYGSSQELSSPYTILYTDRTLENVYFKGETFGGEFNMVINLSNSLNNPYASAKRKLNFNAYLGMGFHSYNSKLYDLNTDELLIDFETNFDRKGDAKSIYYTTGLGVRYKVSKKIDMELRQTINFNNEDHLDAAIANKQHFETFFVTNLGLVWKFNHPDSESIVWQNTAEIKEKEIKKQNQDEVLKASDYIDEILKDTDGDNVIDKFDKEPNTPKGALAYANGMAVDTDKDGVIDMNDKCPLVFGKTENGCPELIDTDGDNVMDKDDLCPEEFGNKYNKGCPKQGNTITEIERTKIISLAKNIFFDSGKYSLRDSSKDDLDKIALILMANPNVKFIIEGHTDSGGKRAYNLALSQKRADAVKNYLVSKGVLAENLTAIGFGFSKPKYNNFSVGGKQLNRRVEIKVNEENLSPQDFNSQNTQTYIVKKYNTLFSIAKMFGVSVENLREWNNLTDNNIKVGDKLIVRK